MVQVEHSRNVAAGGLLNSIKFESVPRVKVWEPLVYTGVLHVLMRGICHRVYILKLKM